MAKVKNPKAKSSGIHQAIRHLGVLMEDTNHEVKLLSEQYGTINTKLDSHTEMIGALAVDMSIVKQDVQATKTDVEIMKGDIEFIKHGLKKKVDVDEFVALERRVAALEKKSSR